ncbi:MAG: IS982 family transposase [Gammaproteobacteria bacterium]|nr:MAG: IS982 family transposase [Gammaproteobacteria bacterium]
MSRDYFIIMVYCLVCEHYPVVIAQRPLRRRGFPPTLTDEEVITIEICGEYFGFHQDVDIYDYFRTHYQHFFPQLRERTGFVRQAANLWFVKAMIQRRLTQISGQAADSVQIIDTLPLPVCTYTRSQRDRCFKPEADYGYCAAKDLHYYGFKLGLRISRVGMIIHYPLLPARPHDSQLLDDLIAGFEGVVPADKAFLDSFRQENLARKRHVELIVPTRKNMKAKPPVAVMKLYSRWRKLVETVGSHLTERYHIAKTRAHDLWHYQHRLIRKVLSHTVCVFLNMQLGRPPLHLDDLVTAD